MPTYFPHTVRGARHILVPPLLLPASESLLLLFSESLLLTKPLLLLLLSSECLLLTKPILSIQPPVATLSLSEVLCYSLHFRDNPLFHSLTLLQYKIKYLRDRELWYTLCVSDKQCCKIPPATSSLTPIQLQPSSLSYCREVSDTQ